MSDGRSLLFSIFSDFLTLMLNLRISLRASVLTKANSNMAAKTAMIQNDIHTSIACKMKGHLIILDTLVPNFKIDPCPLRVKRNFKQNSGITRKDSSWMPNARLLTVRT